MISKCYSGIENCTVVTIGIGIQNNIVLSYYMYMYIQYNSHVL